MQYGHMPRDQNLDGSNSSSFHQNGLGQALGAHLPAPTYSRAPEYRPASHSPPTTIAQSGTAPSPLTFAVQPSTTSPAIKRKHLDTAAHALKRRRDTVPAEDTDPYDVDGPNAGAKHWTDDEKSRLFNWLMGPQQEDHWNALRATKNSCLRECAMEVFGGKKTYQALKGCYERNFNLFKQIYAFETAHGQPAGTNLAALSEADRLREYERRLNLVRKNTDVGSITARTIDHWHRVGWYDLFYRRWHGDPATTRPVQVQGRGSMVGSSSNGLGGNGAGADDADEDDPAIDFHDPSTSMNGLHGMTHERQQPPQQQVNYINPQELRDSAPSSAGLRQGTSQPHQPHQSPHQQHAPHPQSHQPSAHQPSHPSSRNTHHAHPSTSSSNPVPPPSASASSSAPAASSPSMHLTLTPDLINKCLLYLNLQNQMMQEKIEYLKRRETREAQEFAARKEMEKTANARIKNEKAFDLINNPNVDTQLKQAAADYLRKMFMQD